MFVHFAFSLYFFSLGDDEARRNQNLTQEPSPLTKESANLTQESPLLTPVEEQLAEDKSPTDKKED